VNTVALSIVVCTYNRASLLRECLAGLAPQSGPATASEVLIVDNNSTDETARVAKVFCDRYSWFRCVMETNQGLAHARNRGWREASGEYVAFIDDDARPCVGWVDAIRRFAAANPDVAAFGGPYTAFTMAPMPNWFPRDYGNWDLGSTPRQLGAGEFLNGTNMVFSRRVLESMGGFDETFGMRGAQLAYGEETDLMMRMRTRRLHLHYCPDIIVEHAVLDYKMSLRWLLVSAYRNGRSGPNFQPVGPATALGYFFGLVRATLAALYGFASAREPYVKTSAYRAFAPLMWQLGHFVGLLRRRNSRAR
jgi:glucosyl-dolichyl phosphate glucuronosyltransferase